MISPQEDGTRGPIGSQVCGMIIHETCGCRTYHRFRRTQTPIEAHFLLHLPFSYVVKCLYYNHMPSSCLEQERTGNHTIMAPLGSAVQYWKSSSKPLLMPVCCALTPCPPTSAVMASYPSAPASPHGGGFVASQQPPFSPSGYGGKGPVYPQPVSYPATTSSPQQQLVAVQPSYTVSEGSVWLNGLPSVTYRLESWH